MELLDYIIDFHKDAGRQGPGSEEITLRALHAIPGYERFKNILDIGCGTGGQTLTLAKASAARITAVDLFPVFLEKLAQGAAAMGFPERILTKELSMDALDFPSGSFDLLWSEGSAYHIGFARALREWKPLLRRGGFLAVSEISWLRDERPAELDAYWNGAYPEIAAVPEKIAIVGQQGYRLLDHFIFPEECWDNYYRPIRERSATFAAKYDNSPEVRAFVEEGLREADMYDTYKEFYSYVFYIMEAL